MPSASKTSGLLDLTGEVALVTGASSGLGAHFAKVLATHGASVVVCARRRERLDALASEIADAGGRALAVTLDVSSRKEIGSAFDAAEKVFGTVSIVVNNAGISGQKPALEMNEEDWRSVLSVNLDAVWYVAQEAARRMVAGKRTGTIINIASLLGIRAAPTLVAYAAAKAGVIHMTSTLAPELARHGIRVNAIAPGYIVTEMNEAFFTSPKGEEFIKGIPQRRVGKPSDLDGALLLLASERASGFMTGSTIVVDGGHMHKAL
ncbi:MAG: SDR family NAD(P)-dependent oxidoreductase [Parvibaculaceae bacterium]